MENKEQKSQVNPETKASCPACILYPVFCILSSLMVFGDTWQQTTTADFSAAGSVTENTQVINDSVQMSVTPGASWWDPAANWWNPNSSPAWWDTNYQYRKAITIDNKNTSALSDYQVKVENPVYNETGLTGSWHFEETAGTITGSTADTSGYGNNGNLNGFNSPNGIISSGKFGNGISFDESNDFANLSLDISNDNTFSFEFWIFDASTTNSGYRRWITTTTGAVTANSAMIREGDGGTIQIYAGTTAATSAGGGSWKNAWHHFAYVSNGTNTCVYMDGNTAPILTAASSIDPETNFYFGGHYGGTGEYFKGTLDEIRVYDRVLSPAEINAHYEAKAKLNYGDIRFTGNSGTEFPYWMEKDGTFWVKCAGSDSIPVGLSNIYMYYGNASAEAVSNGTNTFDVFEDFKGDLSSWTQTGTAHTISDGVLQQRLTAQLFGSERISMPSSLVTGIWEYTYTRKNSGNFFSGISIFGTDYQNGYGFILYHNSAEAYLTRWISGSSTQIITTNDFTNDLDKQHTLKITRNSYGEFNLYIDNSLKGTATDTSITTSNMLGILDPFGGDSGYTDYANIRVRKYTSLEPSVYAGSEVLQTSLWQYRKTITINNSGTSALSDYQIKIENPLWNETGIAGSWHFENAIGSSVSDSSGNGNTGTISGASFTASGKYGNAFTFNGSSNYIDLPDNSSFATVPATYEAWIKMTSLPSSSEGMILSCDNGASRGVQLAAQNTGNIRWLWMGASGSLDMSSNAVLATGAWYHVAGVVTSGYMQIYINGALDKQGTVNPGDASASNMAIGYYQRTGGYYFNGTIDEPRVYSRALSPAEIQAHYSTKAKLNYGDLRFINSAGTAELPYWQEKDGTFWVKAAGTNSIPAGLSNIYMYYGNSNAVDAGSGTSTFMFFDDFETYATGSQIDTQNGWSSSQAPSYMTIQNDYASHGALSMRGYSPNSSTRPNAAKSFGTIDYDVCLEYDVRTTKPTGSTYDWTTYTWYQGATEAQYNMFWRNYDAPWGDKFVSSDGSANNTLIAYAVNTWYKTRIWMKIATKKQDIWIDNVKKITDMNWRNTGATGIDKFYMEVYGPDAQYSWIDNMRIRRYVSPEPAVIIGSETATDSQWLYRRPVTITNTGSALSDYQIKIENPIYDETGLAGSWHFDGATGGIISNSSTYGLQDTSGKNNNGTASNADGTGMQWGNGQFDGAVHFDGVDDYLDCGSNGSLNATTQFSVSLWFKVDDISASRNLFFRANRHSLYPRGNVSTTGTVSFQYRIDGITKTISSTNTISAGVWYHYAGIIDTASGGKLYINNELWGTNPDTGAAIDGGTSSLLIGYDSNMNYWMKGSMDEIRIYSRALSETEIQAHYSAKAKPNYADIRFTGNSGTEFPYWMEKDGTFWVKIAGSNSIPVGSFTALIYYGNSDATNADNGHYVFEFFDDFNDGGLASKWTYAEGATPATDDYSETNGGLQITSASADHAWVAGSLANVPRIYGSITNIDMELQAKATLALRDADYKTTGIYISQDDDDAVFAGFQYDTEFGGAANDIATKYKWDAGTRTFTGTHFSSALTQYFRITRIGGTFEYFASLDGIAWTSLGTYSKAMTAGFVGMSAWDAGIGIFDDFRVRKYVASEPTVTPSTTTETPYLQTGTFASAAKDTSADNSAIDSVSWTTTGSGTLAMQVRADNIDPSFWTSSNPAWETVTNGDVSITSAGKHIQYKASFTGDGQSAEPILSDVTITYTVPIIPPADSVSSDKLTNTWYSTATFTFTNTIGFGPQIDKYYYAWDNNTTYTFTLTEPVWNSLTPQLQNSSTSDGLWYFHYKPYSSTNTAGTAQDMGPFKYDSTAPPAVTLSLPLNNASISESTTGFTWSTVADLSGVTYTLQLDNYTSFSSPVINKTGLTDPTYTLTGAGAEVLIGNSTYYWRVIAVDSAGNMSYTTNPSYYKFTTASTIPQMINESTGEMYASIQDAIDNASTIDGDTISIEDTIAHTENIILTKNVTLENGILSPASGFAVTGQGATGGEILRNCVITSGGISGLALGENLTIFNSNPTEALVIENSHLVNCLIEYGAIVINSELENCYYEATADYFIDVAGGDFHLTDAAGNAIDKGKNLGAEFSEDMDKAARGIDILDIANFDSAAWDIGAYEFVISAGYINAPQAPSVPAGYYPADGTKDLGTSAVLVWYPSTGSTPIEYAFQVSTSENMTNPYYSGSGITDAFVEINGLSYETVYYWQVRALNGVDYSNWSAIYEFTTQAEGGALPPGDTSGAPNVPELSYPGDNGSGFGGNIIFVWYPSTGATPLTYSLELAMAEDMSLVLYAIDDIENEFLQITSLSYNTTFYWRVKAVNDAGESAWSGVWQFETAGEGAGDVNTALSIPELSLPQNNTVLTELPVTFLWQLQDGSGITYEFQASTNANFAVLTAVYTNITGNTLVPSSVFSYNVNYYWRVRAHDNGGYSDWSSIRVFTVVKSNNTSTYVPADYYGVTSGGTSGVSSQNTVRQKGGCFIKMLVR